MTFHGLVHWSDTSRVEENKIEITPPSLKVFEQSKMDLPPAHFSKDEMQNRRLIVNGLSNI